MSRKPEKFMVLDVEGMQTCRPYNVGYIIADRYGKIYKRRSFAIPAAIWENIANCLKIGQAVEMTKQNVQEILQDMNKGRLSRKYKTVTIPDFIRIFFHDIEKYKIHRVFAYNVLFDKGAIHRLIGDNNFNKLCEMCEFCDIITAILYTKLLTKNYIKFCLKNAYLTPKGYPSYKAEYVIRYLTNNLNYVEEHTGLSDVLDEYSILLTAFNTHKKLDFKPVQAWRILGEFMQTLNLCAA